MRRRLLVVLSAFALAAVAGFAVPLLDATAAGRTQEFVLARTGDLDRFAALAQQATGPAGADTLAQEVQAHHAVYGEGVVVVDRSRRAIVAAGLRADEPVVVAAGHPGAHVSPRAGPTELRELAAAFNRMSDAVATSAEQQRRLVADTSHQLRNPLAALRLRVDTLDPHVAAAGRTTYRSTVVELDRLETLLDGLLDLASAESRATDLAAGAGPADRAELTAVVAERLDAWRPAARRAGVRINAVAPEPVEVACAASELEQVLDVLLDNAVKYAGRGATVEIAARSDGGRARLEVRDDGPGLPAEHLQQA